MINQSIAAIGPVLARLVAATKSFGKVRALDGIDLEIGPGQLVALLGPNGAGKSTIVSLLLGLNTPDQGKAELFGQPAWSIAARRNIGVMLQEASLPGTLRVGELIKLVSSYYPDPRPLEETAALANVQKLLKRPYLAMSGGQKRKVQFALAICGRPRLLFLDEPTVGLDIEARECLWGTLKQLVREGVSILLTTHYLEEAEQLATQIVFVHNGKILAAGEIDAVRALARLQRLTCVTMLDEGEVRLWPHVREVSREGRHLVVSTTDADSVLKRVLSGDSTARDLDVRSLSLDHVLKELIKEHAHD